MRTDNQIKQDILDELSFQPNIDETQIGVIVEDGVVTLTGIVNDFYKKVTSEKIAKRIKGVKAVAEDIEVKYGTAYKITDKEIAKSIVHAFEWNTAIPEDKILIEIRNGWVTLSGEVEFWYQKDAARSVIVNMLGVKGITNNINIKPIIKPYEIQNNITNAFKRHAGIDANNIIVDLDGNTVTLSGKINSISQKEEANKMAYNTSGVLNVINNLEVIGIHKHHPFVPL